MVLVTVLMVFLRTAIHHLGAHTHRAITAVMALMLMVIIEVNLTATRLITTVTLGITTLIPEKQRKVQSIRT